MTHEFKCAFCKEIYQNEWSDEEAMKEFNEKFQNLKCKNLIVACDDCYKQILRLEESMSEEERAALHCEHNDME